ncbi:LPXTG cell wall anchor domain-containing protein [Lachnospiraceae bacterium AM23-7LB]|nr:LPXTG cell wall anchor domain-containing protein [Lachnospiraceae bacterium AM23-7LB]
MSDIFWLFLQFSNNVFMILMMSFVTFATLIIIRKKRKDYIS